MRISLPFPRTRGKSGAGRQRWLLVPVALVVIAGVAVWRAQAGAATTAAVTTGEVTQGTLTTTVSGSGSVAAARTIAMPFQVAGTVTSVAVRVGDQVSAGQTLAQLDAGDLALQLQQAEAGLKAAEAGLAAARGGGATAQDLASARAQLDSANAQLEQTRTGSATAADITSARAALDSARARLEALRNPTAADRAAAQRALDEARTALDSTRTSASQAKTNAELALKNAVNSLTQAQSRYATAKQNWDFVRETGQDPSNPETTDSSGRTVENKVGDTQRQQYYDTFVQAEAALDSAQNAVTQAQVAYDAARAGEVTQIAQAEGAVADAQSQLDTLLNPSASDVAQAQATVTQAQAALDKLRQGGTALQVTQAAAAVTQAQASLERLTAPASDAELASAEASLLQAQVNVAAAKRNLADATLTAPFDGVVAAVSVTPGTLVSAGTAAVTVVDRSTLHVDVSLSETDAATVAVGQPVTLTFDALPDVSVTGKVATVAPAATVSQNVVTYPVQIEFDPGDTPVKVGMSATADIQIQQIADAVLVPSRAVQTAGTGKVLTVLYGADRVPVTVQVETGAASEGQTQILSCVETGSQCLRPGDVLQITSATAANAAQRTNQGRTGFGGFGGAGGPPPGAP